MKGFKWIVLILLCIGVTHANGQTSSIEKRLEKMSSGKFKFIHHEVVESYILQEVKERKKDWETALGRADYYLPVMRDTLGKYGLPGELAFAALGWSHLDNYRISDDGGSGFWQMRYIEAKSHDVYISSYVDMRRDYKIATGAAARYLKELYTEYGDWYVCLAAFAMGEVEVNKAIRRAGGETGYWDFHEHLPERYQHIIPAFIAGAYLHSYSSEHRMKPTKYNREPSTSVVIDEWSSLYQVSKAVDTDHDVLKDLNPVFKKDVIPNASRTYQILIPSECKEKFNELGDSVYTFPVEEIAEGEVDPVKEKNTTTTATTAVANSGTRLVYYTVRTGDYLGRIADIYDVGVSQVRRWNGLSGDRINVNQKLKIYVPASKYAIYSQYNGYSRSQLDQIIKQD